QAHARARPPASGVCESAPASSDSVRSVGVPGPGPGDGPLPSARSGQDVPIHVRAVRVAGPCRRTGRALAAVGRSVAAGDSLRTFDAPAGVLSVRSHANRVHLVAQSPAQGSVPAVMFLLRPEGRDGLAASGGEAVDEGRS